MEIHYHCPICDYQGSFRDYRVRKSARCPRCMSLERHRFQYLVASEENLFSGKRPADVLHVGPEPASAGFLRKLGSYVGLDVEENWDDVTVLGDLCDAPFPDESFDLIWASHVLEHIQDVDAAIAEMHRLLRPGGRALLEVPIEREESFLQPEPDEAGHYWLCGKDWYEKYRKAGFETKVFHAEQAPSQVRPGGGEVALCIKSSGENPSNIERKKIQISGGWNIGQ